MEAPCAQQVDEKKRRSSAAPCSMAATKPRGFAI
jgi:hypothetical protein